MGLAHRGWEMLIRVLPVRWTSRRLERLAEGHKTIGVNLHDGTIVPDDESFMLLGRVAQDDGRFVELGGLSHLVASTRAHDAGPDPRLADDLRARVQPE